MHVTYQDHPNYSTQRGYHVDAKTGEMDRSGREIIFQGTPVRPPAPATIAAIKDQCAAQF